MRAVVEDRVRALEVAGQIQHGLEGGPDPLRRVSYRGDREVRVEERGGIAQDEPVAAVPDGLLSIGQVLGAEETGPGRQRGGVSQRTALSEKYPASPGSPVAIEYRRDGFGV